MANLMDKIAKASEGGATLNESKYLQEAGEAPTNVPAINIGLSGDMDGGLAPGSTIIAGPSKHFKTMFALIMMKAYMDKYPDAVGLFYDSEFGASNEYFETVGIDTSRVFHEPIVHIEDLKFKAMQQLEQFERGDRVFILIDSIGNLASKKEAEDAKNQNSAADMSRAKEMKSLYRTITPYLSKIGIPMVAINHTYDTMEMYSKKVVSGGQGPMLSSDTVWIVGRRQDKNPQKELEGYNFIIKIEKSRTVKEGSQIPVMVSFESGIKKYSGLLDMALETGHVYKPKKGWYTRAIADSNGELREDKNWREAQVLNSDEFWEPILEETDFKQKVKEMYELAGSSSIIQFDDEVADTSLIEEETPDEE